jgi:hypothetical protein
MLVKKLHGHSGCEIRIDRQRNKQDSFTSSIVSCPQVYDFGIIKGRHFFDMEFINGQTFSNFVEHADQKATFQIFQKLFDFVNKNNYIDETIEYQILNKIQNMKIDNQYEVYKDY